MLGDKSARSKRFWSALQRVDYAVLSFLGILLYGVTIWILRDSAYRADPLLDTYLEMAGSLVAFTFAANAMVRFRGTHDRISLIFAFGFVLAGLIEAGTSISISRGGSGLLEPSTSTQISIGWLAGRTLLGVLLLA